MSQDSPEQAELKTILAKINTSALTKDRALELLTELKTAIANKDGTYIKSVCSLLNKEELSSSSDDACVRFLGLEPSCKFLSLQYTTPESDDELSPSQYISLLQGEKGDCNYAYVYVDNAFEGFLERDLLYFTELGVTELEVIVLDSNRVFYKGPVNGGLETVVDKTKQEGWLIFIGVIIFISLGILLRRNMG